MAGYQNKLATKLQAVELTKDTMEEEREAIHGKYLPHITSNGKYSANEHPIDFLQRGKKTMLLFSKTGLLTKSTVKYIDRPPKN